jgi:hypothetical protein
MAEGSSRSGCGLDITILLFASPWLLQRLQKRDQRFAIFLRQIRPEGMPFHGVAFCAWLLLTTTAMQTNASEPSNDEGD